MPRTISFAPLSCGTHTLAWITSASTDVAVMLALLKVARIKQNPNHTDNWIDIAGYAACGGEIATGD
jgi:hypothetical protein